MRAHTLGRRVGQLFAVLAVGTGATLGVSAAVAAPATAGLSGVEVTDLATSESDSSQSGDATTDGFEWN